MAARLSLLLAAVCVAALTVPAAARYCTTESRGEQYGIPIKLTPVELSPGIADWNIEIPRPQQCKEVAGTEVKVCDEDASPDVAYLDDDTVYVHRNGDLSESATVYVTVYCVTRLSAAVVDGIQPAVIAIPK